MVETKASFDLDSLNPYVGRQSAKVTVNASDGQPFVAGIAQDDIAVRAGETMNLELYLRGEQAAVHGAQVTVMVGRNYGVFFRAYDQVTLGPLQLGWQRYTGTLTSSVTDEVASLAIGINQTGMFWVDKVSLMPQHNARGWRIDIVEAIRAMRPGIIRFGGSSLIYYDWRTGVGPRNRRAPFENRPWGNMEENDVGVHEFLDFCELVNAQPLICLNSNSATIEQILEEIEYCNGSADSRWGSVRTAMGHPESFNVRYWQIGNEQSGEEYEHRMVDYAQAIRAYHPDLILLASYPSDNILHNLSDEIDYVCPHFYAPCGSEVESELNRLIDAIRGQAKNSRLKIAVTEWNHTGADWGWARAWLLTLYNALNAARMFNLFQRHGEFIDIANRSNMTNSCNSGTLQTSALDLYLTPAYHVQKAYANYAGDQALRMLVETGEVLDVSATRRTTNGEIALFVVNYGSQVEQREIDLTPHGSAGPVRCRVWTLSGPGLEAVNSFAEKTRVSPLESELETSGGIFTYEFPPFSVTILRA